MFRCFQQPGDQHENHGPMGGLSVQGDTPVRWLSWFYFDCGIHGYRRYIEAANEVNIA